VQATQGCPAVGWADDYVDGVRTTAVEALAGLGVTWGSDSAEALKQVEKPVDPSDAADVIQKYASDVEDDVRGLTDTDAPFRGRCRSQGVLITARCSRGCDDRGRWRRDRLRSDWCPTRCGSWWSR
jgi:hypothetical protein